MGASPLDADWPTELRRLVAALLANPLAPRMRVFGSGLSGDRVPRDLDVVCDLDEPLFAGSIRRFDPTDGRGPGERPREEAEALAHLLSLTQWPARTVDGRPLLDLFLRAQGRLLKPTEAGTWWMPAPQGVGVWQKALSRAVPLGEAVAHWRLDAGRNGG